MNEYLSHGQGKQGLAYARDGGTLWEVVRLIVGDAGILDYLREATARILRA